MFSKRFDLRDLGSLPLVRWEGEGEGSLSYLGKKEMLRYLFSLFVFCLVFGHSPFSLFPHTLNLHASVFPGVLLALIVSQCSINACTYSLEKET